MKKNLAQNKMTISNNVISGGNVISVCLSTEA